jgi:DDE superfamily endonuclease
MTLFRESGVEGALSTGLTIGARQYYLYADSGYAIRPYIIAPFSRQTTSVGEQLFIKRIAKDRVTVEWALKDAKKYFSHQAFARKMILSRIPIGNGIYVLRFFGILELPFTDVQRANTLRQRHQL